MQKIINKANQTLTCKQQTLLSVTDSSIRLEISNTQKSKRKNSMVHYESCLNKKGENLCRNQSQTDNKYQLHGLFKLQTCLSILVAYLPFI